MTHPPSSRGQELFAALLLVPLAALCLWLAADGGSAVLERVLSWRWVAVRGVVDRSGVLDCGRRGAGTMPAVRYSYSVPVTNGPATFHGDRVLFGPPPCGSATEALALVAGYPPGAPITVFVDPKDVRQSVLLREVHWKTALMAACMGILAVVALVSAYAFAFPQPASRSSRHT